MGNTPSRRKRHGRKKKQNARPEFQAGRFVFFAAVVVLPI